MKLREDLRTWFKQSADSTPGWDRYDTKGNRAGKCGDSKEGAPYAACLSPAKAGKLGKSGVASFVRRKREAQRKAGRGKKGHGKGGKPIMVDTGVRKLSEQYTLDPKDGLIESLNLLLEKNKPTSPDKWQDCLAQSRAKFDITPSAYSNGWAVQCYKRKGGKWKSISEEKATFSEFLDRGSILRSIKEGKVKRENKKKLSAWKDEQFYQDLERKAVTKDGTVVKIAKPIKESEDGEKKPYKGFVKGKNHPEGGLSRAEAKKHGIHAGIETKREAEKKGGFGKLSDKTQSRRKRFCARMLGMKRKRTSAKTARDPKSKINASLRVWGCRG